MATTIDKTLPTPFDVKDTDTEDMHQEAVFMWVEKAARHGILAANDPMCYQSYDYTLNKYGKAEALPQLTHMFAIPNGELRHKAVAMKLKKQGVKKGVPDIMLPVKTSMYGGLFIEMKRAGKGRLSEEQQKYIDFLHKNNYKIEICFSWQAAVSAITNYLTMENN